MGEAMRLFVEIEPYGDMRPVTTEQLVDALKERGGQVKPAPLGHWWAGRFLGRGRYLVFRLPDSETS